MKLPVLKDNKVPMEGDIDFGQLHFSALRGERMVYENGEPTGEIRHRTYDLKSRGYGGMVSIIVPPEVPLKDMPYNAEVKLINPQARVITEQNYRGADAEWAFYADDIIVLNPATTGNPSGSPKGTDPKPGNNQQPGDGQQSKKD